MAVTPHFSQSLHLYLCIYSRLHTQVQLIYLIQRKAAEVGGGGKQAHAVVMQEFLYLGWGRGSTWLRLHTVGSVLPIQGGFFMSAPVRCGSTDQPNQR